MYISSHGEKHIPVSHYRSWQAASTVRPWCRWQPWRSRLWRQQCSESQKRAVWGKRRLAARQLTLWSTARHNTQTFFRFVFHQIENKGQTVNNSTKHIITMWDCFFFVVYFTELKTKNKWNRVMVAWGEKVKIAGLHCPVCKNLLVFYALVLTESSKSIILCHHRHFKNVIRIKKYLHGWHINIVKKPESQIASLLSMKSGLYVTDVWLSVIFWVTGPNNDKQQTNGLFTKALNPFIKVICFHQ